MTSTISRLGWDLRCLPADGSPGAGIPHAARELWSAFVPLARAQGIEPVAFVSPGASLANAGTIIRLASTRTWALKRALYQQHVSSLFCPSGAVPFGIQIPSFPWIHDLAIFEHPEWFPQSFLRRTLTTNLVKQGIRRASKVFTVSQETAQMVVRHFRIDPSHIVVTGQGIELPNLTGEIPPTLSKPYALVLGTVEPRKNIPFLIDLWPEICHRIGKTIPLVIAGRDGWGIELPTPLPEGVIRITDLSEPLRGALLKQAAVILVPSYYEGFGRVAAEAILAGTPVIASNRGSLPEIVRESGACLPLIRDRWLQTIIQILKTPKNDVFLAEQAKRRSLDFSWDAVATRILANLPVS